jgi:phosphocarrier protein HPr
MKSDARSTSSTREVTIVNPLGLHARPAAEFAKQARAFRSDIFLIKAETRYSAESLIDILRANLNQGETFTLEAVGRDAEEAVEHLARVMAEFKD